MRTIQALLAAAPLLLFVSCEDEPAGLVLGRIFIHGVVTNAAGEGVAGVEIRVEFHPAAPPCRTEDLQLAIGEVVSAADGSFGETVWPDSYYDRVGCAIVTAVPPPGLDLDPVTHSDLPIVVRAEHNPLPLDSLEVDFVLN